MLFLMSLSTVTMKFLCGFCQVHIIVRINPMLWKEIYHFHSVVNPFYRYFFRLFVEIKQKNNTFTGLLTTRFLVLTSTTISKNWSDNLMCEQKNLWPWFYTKKSQTEIFVKSLSLCTNLWFQLIPIDLIGRYLSWEMIWGKSQRVFLWNRVQIYFPDCF